MTLMIIQFISLIILNTGLFLFREILKNETNIIIPNYSNYSKEKEKYFIFFKFKLNAKVIYENIIYLEDQTSLILRSGIHTIKFLNDIDHYINLKLNLVIIKIIHFIQYIIIK